MSTKNLRKISTPITSETIVTGMPVAVAAGPAGNQYTVRYEDTTSGQHTVKPFRDGQPIPATAFYMGTVGADANAVHLYML